METGGANKWRGLGRAMQAIVLTRDERLRSKPSCVEPPSERLVWQGRIWVATQMDFDHSVFCTLNHRFQCVTVSLRPRRAGLTRRACRAGKRQRALRGSCRADTTSWGDDARA